MNTVLPSAFLEFSTLGFSAVATPMILVPCSMYSNFIG